MATSHYFEMWSLQGFSVTEEMEYQRFVRRNFLSFCGDSQEEFETWFADTEAVVSCLPPTYQTPEHQIYIINHLLEGSAREIFLAYHDDWIFDLQSLRRLFSTFFVLSPSLQYISKYVWDYPCHELCRLLDHSYFNDCPSLKNTTLSTTLLPSDDSSSVETSDDWPTAEQATSTWDEMSSFPSSITSPSLEPATEAASRHSSSAFPNSSITQTSTSSHTEPSDDSSLIESTEYCSSSDQSIPMLPGTTFILSSSFSISLDSAVDVQAASLYSSQNSVITQPHTFSAIKRNKKGHKQKAKRKPSSDRLLPTTKPHSSSHYPTVVMISSSFLPERPSFSSATQHQSQLKHSIYRRKRSQISSQWRNRTSQYTYGRKSRHIQLIHSAECHCSVISTSQLLQQKHIRLSSQRRKALYVRFKMKSKLDRAPAIHRFQYVRPPDKHRPNSHYHIGDRIFTKIFTARGKLDPRYSSEPNIVTEIHHPTYSVLNEYTGVVKQFHVSGIRPLIPAYAPDSHN